VYMGLTGTQATKISMYIPQFLCCWVVIQEAAAWSMYMVWQALLDWYCLTGGGSGLWPVAAVGLACLGFVQK
jgi:hypothetical protein